MPEGPQPYRGARRNEMPTQSTASLFLFPNPLTYAKHMPIRMPQMHLSHFPRHVMRRKRHIQPRRNAFPMHRIHIFHPHGHPRTFVARFVPIHLNVVAFVLLPRPPCAPWQRNIWTSSPEYTAPNLGGVPQSHPFFQPHFSNHAKLVAISVTFNIGVIPFAFIARSIPPESPNKTPRAAFRRCSQQRNAFFRSRLSVAALDSLFTPDFPCTTLSSRLSGAPSSARLRSLRGTHVA